MADQQSQQAQAAQAQAQAAQAQAQAAQAQAPSGKLEDVLRRVDNVASFGKGCLTRLLTIPLAVIGANMVSHYGVQATITGLAVGAGYNSLPEKNRPYTIAGAYVGLGLAGGVVGAIAFGVVGRYAPEIYQSAKTAYQNRKSKKASVSGPSGPNPQSPPPVAPVQQAPVQQAPVQQAPVQQAPVQQAPVQSKSHIDQISTFDLLMEKALPIGIKYASLCGGIATLVLQGTNPHLLIGCGGGYVLGDMLRGRGKRKESERDRLVLMRDLNGKLREQEEYILQNTKAPELGDIRSKLSGLDKKVEGIDSKIRDQDRVLEGFSKVLGDQVKVLEGQHGILEGYESRIARQDRQVQAYGERLDAQEEQLKIYGTTQVRKDIHAQPLPAPIIVSGPSPQSLVQPGQPIPPPPGQEPSPSSAEYDTATNYRTGKQEIRRPGSASSSPPSTDTTPSTARLVRTPRTPNT